MKKGPTRKEVIEQARKLGWTDADILYQMTLNKPRRERRDLVRQLAADLGLSEEDALEIARKAAVI